MRLSRARRSPPAALLALALCAGAACASSSAARRSDTYQARKQLVRELSARQDWTTAFYYATELHQLDPKDAEVLTLRGIIYRERGLPGEAETDLKQAIAFEDGLAEAHAALGILYDVTGRGPQAEKHHQRAIALAPENPNYLNNLGFSLFLRKRTHDAIEVYQRAARLLPTSRKVRTNLGFAYAAAGDLARAAHEFDMGGTPAEAKNNLGFAYEQRGDLTNAYELYLEAYRLNPKSERTRANLVEVAKRLGRDVPPPEPPAAEDSTVTKEALP